MCKENVWLAEAKYWIEAAFAEFEMYDLAEKVSVTWSHRFATRAGEASWFQNKIRLSSQLWARMSQQDRYETAVHEAAHIIAHHLHPGKDIKPHGWEWQRVMVRCGVKPERCHKIDTSGLKGKRKRYPAFCPCKTHMITMNIVNKMRRGQVRVCKACRGQLTLDKDSIAACDEDSENKNLFGFSLRV